jgi:hypothetical protein
MWHACRKENQIKNIQNKTILRKNLEVSKIRRSSVSNKKKEDKNKANFRALK